MGCSMKNHYKYIFIVTTSLLLAACSTMPNKKQTNKPVQVKEDTTISASTATINDSRNANTAAAAYADKKQFVPKSIVISSTKNACVDGFNFLKGVNQGQFDGYSTDYSKISQNYSFLNINKEIMDKDSRELLSMTLNKKLDTLCMKVQYAGFQGVKNKLKQLSDI